MPPLFTSFDEAWRWFSDGGPLQPSSERLEAFTAGRAQFVSFEAPVVDRAALAAVHAAQEAISGCSGIELVPDERLHVSVRGVGFQMLEPKRPDEADPHTIGRIARDAAAIVENHAAFDARIGPVNVFPDAIVLEVADGGALAKIRSALSPLCGADSLVADDDHYLPHVTVAAFTSAESDSRLHNLLMTLRTAAGVTMPVRRIELARWWFTGVDETTEVEREVIRRYLLKSP